MHVITSAARTRFASQARVRSSIRYESELMTSPPARVPSAWKIRLDGV